MAVATTVMEALDKRLKNIKHPPVRTKHTDSYERSTAD